MDSKVFETTFDYDDWPGNHINDEEVIRPYNESFFHLHAHYSTIFPERHFSAEVMNDDSLDKSKVFKIKYSINLLPQVGFYVTNKKVRMHEDVGFMNLLAVSDEIELFHTKAVMDMIEYKWTTYGKGHHLFGCFMHFCYVLSFILYVDNVCSVEASDRAKLIFNIILIAGIVYPFFYDVINMCNQGICTYFSDKSNYVDFIFIYGSVANGVLQLYLGPKHDISRIIMCVLCWLMISRTFFFLKIFTVLTPIVVMITNVVFDLQVFLFFYMILITLFCQLFNITGLGIANQ